MSYDHEKIDFKWQGEKITFVGGSRPCVETVDGWWCPIAADELPIYKLWLTVMRVTRETEETLLPYVERLRPILKSEKTLYGESCFKSAAQ